MESRELGIVKLPRVVLDDKRRRLYGQGPGQSHTLLYVGDKTTAMLQTGVVVQSRP